MQAITDFKNWVNIRENKDIVNDLFARTESEISNYFDQLYKAIGKTWGKGSMPIGRRAMTNIVTDLEAILQKLKKPLALSTNESVIHKDELNEAITKGLSSVRTGPSGLSQYSLKDVLGNIKNAIMASMQRL